MFATGFFGGVKLAGLAFGTLLPLLHGAAEAKDVFAHM